MWAAAHRGEPVDWEKLYDGYRASVDWPSCNLWREHAALYPDAKVILTTRDPDSWYDSVMNTIYVASTTMQQVAGSDDATLRRVGLQDRVGEPIRQSHAGPRARDRASTTPTSNASKRRFRNRVCWYSKPNRAGNRCADSSVSTFPTSPIRASTRLRTSWPATRRRLARQAVTSAASRDRSRRQAGRTRSGWPDHVHAYVVRLTPSMMPPSARG